MDVPAHLQQYTCGDYFTSDWATSGFWCEPSQLTVVVPAVEVEELSEVGFLSVGRAGVDGIFFGYRNDAPGVWAYDPIGQEFKFVAPTLAELVRRWVIGEVHV